MTRPFDMTLIPFIVISLYVVAVVLALKLPKKFRSVTVRVVVGFVGISISWSLQSYLGQPTPLEAISWRLFQVLRMISFASYLVMISAAFVARPDAPLNFRLPNRLVHWFLIVLYAAIIAAFYQVVDWTGISYRYASELRYLGRVGPNFIWPVALAAAAVIYWPRCPRAFASLFASGLIGAISIFVIVAGRGRGFGGIIVPLSALSAFALPIKQALVIYSIFAGRGLGVRCASPPVSDVARTPLTFSYVVKGWIGAAVLLAATFLPWLHSRTALQPTSSSRSSITLSSRTVNVHCDAWHTSFRLWSARVPMGLLTVGCAVFAAFFAQYRGTDHPHRMVAQIASGSAATVTALFVLLLEASPTTHAGIGMLIGLAALVSQLLPSWRFWRFHWEQRETGPFCET